jgi:predicted Zn-dependent protease
MLNHYERELDGKSYTWDGKGWYASKTFMRPPKAIVSKLNALLQEQLSRDDAAVAEPSLLLERARQARDNQQLDRALQLLRRVLKLRPEYEGALAVLCSVLRKQGAPEKALQETEAFRHLRYSPLLTSRAAAMCDLGMWEAAKREIARVLVMPGDHAEAFEVVHRIKAARPELYEG